VEKAHAKGKWKRAARLLQQALELSVAVPASPADQATLWNSLGYAHMMRQRLPAAEAAFQKGLALNPHHRDLLANLANLSMQSGRFEQAFGCLQRATQLEPSDASLLIALGKCALELGMLDVALDSFRKALAITPDNEDLQNAVMQLQAREGR
jgi:Flp pilus assembly protein TadD